MEDDGGTRTHIIQFCRLVPKPFDHVVIEGWLGHSDLNREPLDYETNALAS